MSLSGNITVFGIDPMSESSTPVHPLGTKGIAADGRIFRYAHNSTVALTTARLLVQAAISANHEDIVFQTAGAVGDKSVALTIATTSVAANEYDGGYLVIIDDTGEGHTHLITKHGTGTGTVTFYISPFLEEATTTATTVTLVRNPYNLVVVAPGGTQTNLPAGVTPIAVTASYYFWAQTGGMAAVLSSGTNTCTAGEPATIGEATDGSLSGRDAVAEPLVGIALTGVAPTSGEENPYLLLMDT